MRVLLCGSTGMLGKAVVKEFSKHGVELYTLSRTNADINLDVVHAELLTKHLNELEPDIIINALANVNLQLCEANPSSAYLINARPVSFLADYASSRNKYLIQISTDHFYADQKNILHDEKAPITLLNEYARTKYAAECFALTAPNSLVIRTNIIGFRNLEARPTFVEWVLRSLHNQENMKLFENVYASSIAVSQFAEIMYDLILRKAKGILNIASAESVSKKDFVLRLARKFELNTGNVDVASYVNGTGVQRSLSMGLNVGKAERLLGYTMPDLEQVIDRLYVDYFEGEQS
ncbi:sugar nucleotide-binding protein [Paenibacillus sp. FSL M7-0802]|uniref:sugar nucleotide-binding protein n=1 Tax=Paenibacillus TaxID=44249 RepID=UPI0003D32F6D|nr:sugar nucleotide-binding protein [Paenibacillus polymyxa]AIW41941.1 hypothetical protein X809_39485 [Paenibacillus polymyxa CR1]